MKINSLLTPYALYLKTLISKTVRPKYRRGGFKSLNIGASYNKWGAVHTKALISGDAGEYSLTSYKIGTFTPSATIIDGTPQGTSLSSAGWRGDGEYLEMNGLITIWISFLNLRAIRSGFDANLSLPFPCRGKFIEEVSGIGFVGRESRFTNLEIGGNIGSFFKKSTMISSSSVRTRTSQTVNRNEKVFVQLTYS